MKQVKPKKKITPQEKRRLFRLFLLFGCAFLLVLSAYTLSQRFSSYLEARTALSAEEEKLASAQLEYKENMNLYEESQSSLQMEKLAREELGMVKPGETVYRLTPDLVPPSSPSPEATGLTFWQRMWQAISSFFAGIFR